MILFAGLDIDLDTDIDRESPTADRAGVGVGVGVGVGGSGHARRGRPASACAPHRPDAGDLADDWGGRRLANRIGRRAPGLAVRRLVPRWTELIAGLQQLGPVTILTGNGACSLAQTTTVGDVQVLGADAVLGRVRGPDLDLRLSCGRWAHGVAVVDAGPADAGGTAVRHHLHLADATGATVLTVAAGPATRLPAWHDLVARLADPDRAPGRPVRPRPPAPAPGRAVEVDVAGFRRGWAASRTPHDLFALMRRHGLARLQALRLAEPRFAAEIDAPGAARDLLTRAAGGALPITVRVGNAGAVHARAGTVRRIVGTGPWVEVRDPGLHLRLREDRVRHAWLVRTPTADGLRTALELFDADGATVAMVEGLHRPGRPEACGWRRLVASLAGGGAWAGEDDGCAAC